MTKNHFIDLNLMSYPSLFLFKVILDKIFQAIHGTTIHLLPKIGRAELQDQGVNGRLIMTRRTDLVLVLEKG